LYSIVTVVAVEVKLTMDRLPPPLTTANPDAGRNSKFAGAVNSNDFGSEPKEEKLSANVSIILILSSG
jgi:hypothetical protein